MNTTKFFYVTLVIFISYPSQLHSSLIKAKIASWFSSKPKAEDEQKRAATLTTALYDETLLPLDLINIIGAYDSNGAVFARHGAAITSFALLPEGLLASGSADGMLNLWNADGSLHTKVEQDKGTVSSLILSPKKELIMGGRPSKWGKSKIGVEISLSDRLFASVLYPTTVAVWNEETGKEVKQFKYDHTKRTASEHAIHALVFVPSKQLLVSGGSCNHLEVADLQNNTEGPVLKRTDVPSTASLSVYALELLPDDLIASGWSDGAIGVFDPVSGKSIKTFKADAQAVKGLVLISPTVLASLSQDGKIRLWNLKTYQCTKTFDVKGAVLLARVDDKTFVSGSDDGTIRRWRLE